MPGFSFGFGSSNKNDSFNGTDTFNKTDTINQTETPTNAPWVTDLAGKLAGGVSTLAGTDPYSYVSGPNANQTAAYGAAAGLGQNGGNWGQAYGNIAGAGDVGDLNQMGHTGSEAITPLMQMMAPTVGAASGSQFYDQNFSPYVRDVYGTTMNDFDHNAGQTRAQQALSLAGSGAFGGSGAAITQSMTEGELARARAATGSNVLNTGYNEAMGFGQQDANRKLSADTATAQLEAQRQHDNQATNLAALTGNADRAQTNKGLNASILQSGLAAKLASGQGMAGMLAGMGADSRANIAAQQSAGADQRAIDQQKITAPLDFQQYMNNLFAQLPANLFHGTETNGTDVSTGTESQSGTSKGKSTSTSFGFGGG